MMDGGWLIDLSRLPVPVIGLVTLGVMLLGAVVGQALRRWRVNRSASKVPESEASVAHEGLLLGSVLGTLGLLLAFSFGMVLDRYETRRDLAIKEANAIGTAYLRAQFLDEPYRSQLSKLLLDYTDNRIRLGSFRGETKTYLATNDRLLTEIWANLRAARESALAHGLTTTLLTTFNEVIDLDAERKVAWELRLPPEVLLLLLSYLIITAVVIGYQIDGPRGRRAALVMSALLALAISFLADINRPMSGQSRETQKPLIMLLQSLRAQPPHVFDLRDARGEELRR